MISHKHPQPNFKFGYWYSKKMFINVLSYLKKNGKYNRITISNKQKYKSFLFEQLSNTDWSRISSIVRALL